MTPLLLLLLTVLAILAAWTPVTWRNTVMAGAFGGLLGAALWAGAIAPIGLIWVAALFSLAWWSSWDHSLRPMAEGLLAALALAIGVGALPGLSPVLLSEAAVLKVQSVPYLLRFSLGKPLVAMALLWWRVPVMRHLSFGKTSFVHTVTATTMTSAIVLLVAWMSGYIRPSLEMPAATTTLKWMVVNLLLVCTAEEAFFRGLLQGSITRYAPWPIAVGVTSVCFGAAHSSGGILPVVLATLTGIGYGVVYERSGRCIEASIVAHFGVNAMHFLSFTYPYAA